MRELVIVIPDLYLVRGRGAELAVHGSLPGLEHAGRFGRRTGLAGGWRGWLAGWLGDPQLASAPVAAVAAASLAQAAAATDAGDCGASAWIATPVELVAGLARVHLGPEGILRLTDEELHLLAGEFDRVLGGTGLRLQPLCDGNLLLRAPGIAAVATIEPARLAGRELTLPQGAAAAPLLRLTTEIEMWLHQAALNEARRARGQAPVTALWLWGGEGTPLARTVVRRREPLPRAFGSDAYVRGLWHLHGGACDAFPESLEDALAAGAGSTVVVVEVGRELREDRAWTLERAVAALDHRVVQPALQGLRNGTLGRLRLVANDTLMVLGRRSALKRWRPRRAGLTGFA